VVPEREHVRPRGKELVGQARRQPRPVGGVLAVDDAEADAELIAQPGEARLDRLAARRPEDVRDEEDPQGKLISA
jgi:hypothetical protein